MKKKTIYIKLLAVLLICTAMPTLVSAQSIKNGYLNIDWQLNSPIGNDDYANKISGWGAQAEGGYYLTSGFSVGAFVAFHTNNKYIGKQTLQIGDTGSITGDQQHSIFQIPFGAALRYAFLRKSTSPVEPYIGAKLGTSYSEVSSYMNIFKTYERKWGFFASPEVGVTIYPTRDKNFGFHLAAYYNYATNKSELLTYNLDGLSNWGFRFGIAF